MKQRVDEIDAEPEGYSETKQRLRHGALLELAAERGIKTKNAEAREPER
jgi:hypothetical protein